MNILQIHNRYRGIGGEDVVVDTEATLLRRAGHTVHQHLAQNPHGSLAATATIVLAPWNPFTRTDVGRVAKAGFDVAHVHNTWYALSPSIVSGLKRAGLRVVVTVHNYRFACVSGQFFRDGHPCRDCLGRSPSLGVRHRCYRESVVGSSIGAATITLNRMLDTWNKWVDLFLVPSPDLASVLEVGGIEAGRIALKPHIVLDPGPRSQPPSDSATVLYVGRLSPEKGIERLLASWSQSAPAGLNLVVVGDGPLGRDSLRQRHPDVSFVGELPHSEIQPLMRRSRALIFPSVVAESFGLVAAEAMSAGLPVLVNESLPLLKMVGEDRGLVGLKDEAWPKGVSALADDSAINRQGEAARRTYIERFSPTVGLAALENALQPS